MAHDGQHHAHPLQALPGEETGLLDDHHSDHADSGVPFKTFLDTLSKHSYAPKLEHTVRWWDELNVDEQNEILRNIPIQAAKGDERLHREAQDAGNTGARLIHSRGAPAPKAPGDIGPQAGM